MTISIFTSRSSPEDNMIDIIITTYNRPAKVLELVNQLFTLPAKPEKVIVVDSSDIDNYVLKNTQNVKYLKSSHKNQPYQRYLGFLNSDSEYLVFLDDDMEVTDGNFISKINQLFKNPEISGIAIKFENKHENSLLAQMPSTMLDIKNSRLKRLKGWLTGYPELKPGKFGLCGNRGKQPEGGGETEWLSGGAFAARRSTMFQNFNFQLFDIFEKKMGMGEDAIIGYGLSKQGKLLYHAELFFLHNDQKDSTYTMDKQAYAMRVVFSRLFLSLERMRLNKGSLMLARIHYHYYMFWRLTGLLFNYLLRPSSVRFQILKGSIAGLQIPLNFNYSSFIANKTYWEMVALSDLKQIK